MSALRKLGIVIAIQAVILLGVIGFKQYTVWTGETVVLETVPIDPRDLLRGDYVTVRYEISTLDTGDLAGDDSIDDTVYVELRREDDGYWRAVAVHEDRRRDFDDTVLLKGKVTYQRGGFSRDDDAYNIDYGIEEIFIPEGSGRTIDEQRSRSLAVELKVDRFGNAVPRHLLVDGERLDLERR